ncbi:MAG: alpha/beta fold hydrolase [Pontibacterium sp.]
MTTLALHHKIVGEGEPLLIMHGLFGNLDNWGAQIKALSEKYKVIALDLRNHGKSPHHDEVGYKAMANDVIALMDDLNLKAAHIVGHSMGGKVAMQLAMNYPHRVNKLVIVDIAPVQYPAHHSDVFAGLNSVDLASIANRTAADKQLAEHVDNEGVRAFLLRNLYRDDAKQFQWRMNLKGLEAHYNQIAAPPIGKVYNDSVLFIKGAKSDYMVEAYRDALLSLFPKATYQVIAEAGHWPHAEKPAQFTRTLVSYLES